MDGFPLPGELAGKVAGAIGRKDSSELVSLLDSVEIADQAREEVLALPRLFGGRDVLDRAAKVVRNDRSRRALDNLSQVLDVLDVYGVLEHVTLDLGELRGLNYHTGITFQGFLSGIGRAVCSGGRYDNLTEQYGFPAPATGFTFDLLNLLFALDKKLDERVTLGTDVLIFARGKDLLPAQKLARGLRQRGFSVARDIIERPLDESLDYAHKTDFKVLLAVGSEQEEVRVIRIDEGQERNVSYRELLSESFKL